MNYPTQINVNTSDIHALALVVADIDVTQSEVMDPRSAEERMKDMPALIESAYTIIEKMLGDVAPLTPNLP